METQITIPTTDGTATITVGIGIATIIQTTPTTRIIQITTTSKMQMEALVIRVTINRIYRNIVILVELETMRARTALKKHRIAKTRQPSKIRRVGVRETVPTQTTDKKIQGKILRE